jgi:alpha/beta superfamily hydrolase
VIEALRLHTADGLELAAELFVPEVPVRAGMVLCHPHPLSGGTMRGVVIEALFGTLPGVAALRFDFRGVPGSDGQHDGGDTERLDVRAAVDVLDTRLPAAVPLVLAGWSFGADLALSTHPDRVAAWFAVAPPLHFLQDAPTADPRPKLLALAGRDEIRPAWEVVTAVGGWVNTEKVVLRDASHFFGGGTDDLVRLAGGLVDRLTATP